MSDIPKTFDGGYYDRHYFQTPEGKKYRISDGSLRGWSYNNETGEFLGAAHIVKSWKEVFNSINLLDVGAGRGTFVAYAREVAGIEAFGLDFSEWGVGGGRDGEIGDTLHKCKAEWLRLHDATDPWPYEDDSFELVVALDFYEHIYEEDLDFVIGELYRVSSKYVFLQIAVSGTGGLQGREQKGYFLNKGEKAPEGLEGCAVAGHVTVKPETWWLDRLEHEDWLIRRDLKEHFVAITEEAVIRNWLLNSIIVLEKL